MTDRSRKPEQPKAKPSPAGAPKTDPTPPSSGGPASCLDWQRVAAGVALLGISLFLLVAQGTAPSGSDTSLFSGPVGMAMNVVGIVAGVWVLWTARRR